MTRGWFKSSHSNPSGSCVEVNLNSPTQPRIRDSKHPTTELPIPPQAWKALLTRIVR
jgi:hypothetical protein